ncbi:MAG: class II aldolase/adducin family protein [Chloroflexi bacterium]|nr:MAG: class II aldolase/adducin family protein [Chloroflexota bacterium]
MAVSTRDLRQELLETARRVSASGVLSLSGHGNLSLRVPGRDEMLFTAGGSLRDLPPEGVVRLRLDGELLEGEIAPMANAVIPMHGVVYQELGAGRSSAGRRRSASSAWRTGCRSPPTGRAAPSGRSTTSGRC